MAAYRRVYDSPHLHADCAKNRDQLRNPTLGNQLWATFTFLSKIHQVPLKNLISFFLSFCTTSPFVSATSSQQKSL